MGIEAARVVAGAGAGYRGVLTTPERWATWTPRAGDILVCTPPKCGTTWTQTMLSMLVRGGTELPGRLGDLSPWVDCALGEAEAVAEALAAQEGRRVVKTHTPADGFPVWEGVTVVAVYRHPLDVFFSLRKHAMNMRNQRPDHPMLRPAGEALAEYIAAPLAMEDFDRDTLATVTRHYAQTVLSGRVPGLVALHYADMVRDGRATVRRLAEAVGIAADEALIAAVAEATGFDAMRAAADRYVPEGGKGFWAEDRAFFDSGTSGKWRGQLSEADLARYAARMEELLPDPVARRWLEVGGAIPD